MSNLLILANNFDYGKDEFEEHFDRVDKHSLADVTIDSNTGETSNVLVDGTRIEEWGSLYIKPEPKAFNYTRVLLEVLSNKDIDCNMDASSIFILTKKPYLSQVLSSNGNSIPRQASVSTEKGLTELTKDVEFPVVAKKYSDLQLKEDKVFEDFEELKTFAELTEHGRDFLMIQEYDKEKSCFDILYIDGKLIGLKAEGAVYEDSGEVSRSYYGISGEQKKIVKNAVESIGTGVCRVRLKGKKIMDMSTDPMLEMFKNESGKNVYGRVADYLKTEENE
jgi:glutathione synthase/RimK-type ligase-like ATP-grasp enzyme